MSQALGRLRIKLWWKWAALAIGAVLIVFLLWFFVFRGSGTSPNAPVSNPPPRFALGQTITYPQYVAAVDTALSDVQAARSDAGKKATKLKSAASALEQVDGANISGAPGGNSPVQVDNGAITAELEEAARTSPPRSPPYRGYPRVCTGRVRACRQAR